MMEDDQKNNHKKEKIMTTETTDKTAEKAITNKETPSPKKEEGKITTPAPTTSTEKNTTKTENKEKKPMAPITPPPLVKTMGKPKIKDSTSNIPSHVDHTDTSIKKNSNNRNKKNQPQGRKKSVNFSNRRRNSRDSNNDHFVEPEMPPIPEGVTPTITKIADLQRMTFEELVKYAKNIGLESVTNMNRSQIVFAIVKTKIHNPAEILVAEGTLEILPDGFGFLRSPQYSYLSSAEDIYVSPAQIRHYALKKGDEVYGPIRIPKEKDKYFALLRVEKVNELEPKAMGNRKSFVNFTPIHPTSRLMMETNKDNFSTRVIDLVSPVGKGQRALIVAPPKAGKTILLQNIIQAISTNEQKTKLLVLLIDERPEEVTDMKRLLGKKGQVIASTFDEPPERHCVVAEMCIEKAKRLVEMGEDVVIILDSITRLARAYNAVQPHSGRILSGGVDANAMHKPKRFFGAARNLEEGGSLTIIGSALIDTGSKMDEVIYEEFKGTGNLELVLDRRLADRRLYPAIDVIKSGTRKEDLLYHEQELEKVYKLRAALADLSPADAMNLLLSRMKKTNTNTEFLLSMKD